MKKPSFSFSVGSFIPCSFDAKGAVGLGCDEWMIDQWTACGFCQLKHGTKPHLTFSVLSAQTTSCVILWFILLGWEHTPFDPSATLLADLSSEVKILQAELHRAHRLIEGYNLAFEREERTNRYQILGLELFILFLAIVTLVLLNPWIWRRRASPPPAPLQVLGNTGGSSDSESGSEDQIPLTWPGTVRGRGGGPVRPSLLGKGHKK